MACARACRARSARCRGGAQRDSNGDEEGGGRSELSGALGVSLRPLRRRKSAAACGARRWRLGVRARRWRLRVGARRRGLGLGGRRRSFRTRQLLAGRPRQAAGARMKLLRGAANRGDAFGDASPAARRAAKRRERPGVQGRSPGRRGSAFPAADPGRRTRGARRAAHSRPGARASKARRRPHRC